ncbi:IS1634 family transposase, partial [Patescibacteria group bacterium]|nr:IS1634 family transposase [Patescibacteria group bacterium]
DYLYRYQRVEIKIDQIYRFLDELADKHQEQIETIIFNHTKQLLGGKIQVVFYDMTTLYFETESEDDLRKTGFSKDGKFHHPQIMLGLLTTTTGYPLGYELFPGNTFEGKTLIPAIRRLEEKFGLDKPVVVADAGLFSQKNLQALSDGGYEYILGARIKNESSNVKQQILDLKLSLQKPVGVISKNPGDKQGQKHQDVRLIVGYSKSRATKDQFNRKKGLRRLEKRVKTGKLTKTHLSSRGYNKYLQLQGKAEVQINYQKFNDDGVWDGLKGYITNTRLKPETIITHYSSLWLIEKAFRISKTDLRIRPIYHSKRNRIEAHLSIVFAAYAVYKELERLLKKHQIPLSVKKAAKLTHNMYALFYIDPETKIQKQIILQMDQKQKLLYQLIHTTQS